MAQDHVALTGHGGSSPLPGTFGATGLVANRPQARFAFVANEKRSGPMGWAAPYIEKLRRGESVAFRPRGQSMAGKIESGQLCTVAACDPRSLEAGDIVLCKVNGREYLHLVKAIQGSRFQIGNNRGRINGWVTAGAIFGKCIRIEN